MRRAAVGTLVTVALAGSAWAQDEGLPLPSGELKHRPYPPIELPRLRDLEPLPVPAPLPAPPALGGPRTSAAARAYAEAVGRALGERVTRAEPTSRSGAEVGVGVRATFESGVAVERLRFASQDEAVAFAGMTGYSDQLHRADASLLVIEARGRDVVILTGAPLTDPARAARVRQAAWGAIPGAPPSHELLGTIHGDDLSMEQRGHTRGPFLAQLRESIERARTARGELETTWHGPDDVTVRFPSGITARVAAHAAGGRAVLARSGERAQRIARYFEALRRASRELQQSQPAQVAPRDGLVDVLGEGLTDGLTDELDRELDAASGTTGAGTGGSMDGGAGGLRYTGLTTTGGYPIFERDDGERFVMPDGSEAYDPSRHGPVR